MTQVLVWKELREQWVVWLALVLVAAAAVAGVSAMFYADVGSYELLTGILGATAWAYGLICGAHLFAGEAEGATQVFLDTLPATRRHLWRAKAGAGLVLVTAQVAALVGVGFALIGGARHQPLTLLPALPVVPLLGVAGYAWGLYCGSFGRNVLGAIARAIASQVVVSIAATAGVALLAFSEVTPRGSANTLLATFVGLATAGAVVRSRSIYCRTDRLRLAPPGPRKGIGVRLARWGASLRRAAWEARWFALGMAVYGFLGMAALAFGGSVAWPVWTLVLGVVCGVTVAARECGWMARAVVRFAVGVLAAALTTTVVILPRVVQLDTVLPQTSDPFHARVPFSAVAALSTNPWLFLSFGLIEGYASGFFSSVLFRNRLTAAAAGLLLAGVFGGVWLPTLYLAGGLHARHMLAVPAIFLAATFLLALTRNAGRLTTPRLVSVAACALVAAVLATAAALRFRAEEIPAAPDAVDVEAYLASLPDPEQNVAGRLTADALDRLRQIHDTPDDGEAGPRLVQARGQVAFVVPRFDRYFPQAAVVNGRGWRADDRDLGRYLDKLFDNTWDRDLAEAAEHPTGLVEDPRGRTLATPERGFFIARAAALFLSARSLQRQADGKPEVLLDNLKTGLGLARNLRYGTVATVSTDAQAVEWILARGVERWLERLDGRPDLLRRVLETLREHLESPRPDPGRHREARLLITLNSLEKLQELPRSGNGVDPFFAGAPADTGVLQFALAAPWERTRLRRVLDGLASADPELQKLAFQKIPPALGVSIAGDSGLVDIFPLPPNWQLRYPVPAAVLQVALRLYQEETGHPAEKLDELVPEYLASVPLDPGDGQPFRYRLSRGETLDWPPDDYDWQSGKAYDPRPVPAGQGILWGVGRDGHDDGGHAQEGPESNWRERPSDRIFLVPLPPGRP